VTIAVCVEPKALGSASRAALALARGLAPGHDIVAIAAGPAGPAPALTEALRAGVGRAIHVADAALDQAEFPALGLVLAAAARRVGASLILTGTSSDQEGRGVVPAAIAHSLPALFITGIEEAAAAAESRLIVRLRAGGSRRRLELQLPALLTVARHARVVATADGKSTGSEETLTIADLGIDAACVSPRPGLVGTLERSKRRMTVAKSADELVRRWLVE